MAHFEIFKDDAQPPEFRFRLIADNGEIVAQSEGYDSDYNAERGASDLVHAAMEARSPVPEGTGFSIKVERV